MDPKNNPGIIPEKTGDGVPVPTAGNEDEKGVVWAEAREYRKVRHWNMPAADMGGKNRELLLEEIAARLRTIEQVLLRLERFLRPEGPSIPPAGD